MTKTIAKYHNNGAPHIGQAIEHILKAWRVPEVALAHQLGRSRSTVEQFYKQKSIQTAILWEVSQVMSYNFFSDIAEQLPADFRHQATAAEKEIAALKAENAQLKQEIATLERVVQHLK